MNEQERKEMIVQLEAMALGMDGDGPDGLYNYPPEVRVRAIATLLEEYDREYWRWRDLSDRRELEDE